jgi:hypothetical protein
MRKVKKMTVNIQEHELFHQYTPCEESELYQAMMAELQVRTQRDYAWQVLSDRTHELRDLLCQLNSFNSETAVEEVPLVQARAEGLRWLIKRIEQEIRELEQACDLKARKVLALVGQAEERNGRHKAAPPDHRPISVNGQQAECVATP